MTAPANYAWEKRNGKHPFGKSKWFSNSGSLRTYILDGSDDEEGSRRRRGETETCSPCFREIDSFNHVVDGIHGGIMENGQRGEEKDGKGVYQYDKTVKNGDGRANLSTSSSGLNPTVFFATHVRCQTASHLF
ncbi:Beta-galactosidase [Psidium guajava]|nr:Beta-galactosidase [Psidium guajava]